MATICSLPAKGDSRIAPTGRFVALGVLAGLAMAGDKSLVYIYPSRLTVVQASLGEPAAQAGMLQSLSVDDVLRNCARGHVQNRPGGRSLHL